MDHTTPYVGRVLAVAVCDSEWQKQQEGEAEKQKIADELARSEAAKAERLSKLELSSSSVWPKGWQQRARSQNSLQVRLVLPF